MSVVRWDSQRDGPLSEETLTRKIENRGYQVSKYIYPPGTYFSDHSHACDKIDGVLSGQLKMTLKDAEIILQAGDYLTVPKGTVHSAEVLGNEAVVSLDAVSVRG